MKRSLTMDFEAELLDKAELRAAQAGLDCTQYVRALIERDVHGAAPASHRFASEDLVGAFELSGECATNPRVREQLRRRAAVTHARDC